MSIFYSVITLMMVKSYCLVILTRNVVNVLIALIALMGLKFAGTGLTLYLSDRIGRKILLLCSGFGMAVAMAILGTSFILSSNEMCQNNNININNSYTTDYLLQSNLNISDQNNFNDSVFLLQNNTYNNPSSDLLLQHNNNLSSNLLLQHNNNNKTSVFLLYLPLFGMCLFFFAYAIGFNSVILILLGELYAPGTTSRLVLKCFKSPLPNSVSSCFLQLQMYYCNWHFIEK